REALNVLAFTLGGVVGGVDCVLVVGHWVSPTFKSLCGLPAPKTAPESLVNEGCRAACWRASNCSSRTAASISALRAQDRFAISDRRPPERTQRHMPGCLLSGTTSPMRRLPLNRRQPVPARFHVRDAPTSLIDFLPKENRPGGRLCTS